MNLVEKYLNPKNDMAFKRLFGTAQHKDILIAMLNAVLKDQLHHPIAQIRFLSPVKNPALAGNTGSIVKVLCQDKYGGEYVIGMQIGPSDNFQGGALYYAASAFVDGVESVAEYYSLKGVIALAFCDFSPFPKKKDYKSTHMIFDKQTHKRNLDLFSATFIDLVKFDKQCTKSVEELTKEEKFYYFLCHATTIKDEDLALLIKDPDMKQAFTALARLGWSDKELALYEAAEKRNRH